MSGMTIHVVGPTHLVGPYYGNQEAVLMGHDRGLVAMLWTRGFLALASWSTPPSQKIRIYLSVADPRRCWPIGYHFKALSSHPQAYLREEDEGHH
jgi:hypothetical protein